MEDVGSEIQMIIQFKEHLVEFWHLPRLLPERYVAVHHDLRDRVV